MITVEQKIGEKVFTAGRVTKFPPLDDTLRTIADMRGYLDNGADILDYRQMACGAYGIPREYSWAIHYWESTGGLQPIRGLFEKSNPLKAACLIQERIHFLGFVREYDFEEGEIGRAAYYLANPHC